MSTTKKTTVVKSAVSKPKSKFVSENLKKLNKSEKEVQEESIVRFVEDAIIEGETQISYIRTNRIPTLQHEVKRIEVSLERANKDYEEARFSTASNFTEYVSKREEALDRIDEIKHQLSSKKAEIAQAEAELSTLEAILEDLK